MTIKRVEQNNTAQENIDQDKCECRAAYRTSRSQLKFHMRSLRLAQARRRHFSLAGAGKRSISIGKSTHDRSVCPVFPRDAHDGTDEVHTCTGLLSRLVEKVGYGCRRRQCHVHRVIKLNTSCGVAVDEESP